MNTIEFLQIAAAVVPEREALTEVGGHGRRLSYEETLARVTRLANALRGLGVERGGKVAAVSQNSADFVLTYYACAMLGATLVPLNYRSKDEELTYMLNVSEAEALLASERYLDLVRRIKPALEHTRAFICYDGAADGFLDFAALVADAPEEELWTEVDDDQPTVLIFTSGTTAQPKGVMVTYLDMTAYVTNTMNPADPEVHEKTLVSVPFFHVAGATTMLGSLWAGRRLAILPQFDPSA